MRERKATGRRPQQASRRRLVSERSGNGGSSLRLAFSARRQASGKRQSPGKSVQALRHAPGQYAVDARLPALRNDSSLWDLCHASRIQIHLVTLDAVKQGSALPSDRTLGPDVTPASWLNLYQTEDTEFREFPKLKGSKADDFPGDLDHSVPADNALSGLKNKNGKGNGRHAKMPLPEAVRKMIDEHLYTDPDEP